MHGNFVLKWMIKILYGYSIQISNNRMIQIQNSNSKWNEANKTIKYYYLCYYVVVYLITIIST